MPETHGSPKIKATVTEFADALQRFFRALDTAHASWLLTSKEERQPDDPFLPSYDQAYAAMNDAFGELKEARKQVDDLSRLVRSDVLPPAGQSKEQFLLALRRNAYDAHHLCRFMFGTRPDDQPTASGPQRTLTQMRDLIPQLRERLWKDWQHLCWSIELADSNDSDQVEGNLSNDASSSSTYARKGNGPKATVNERMAGTIMKNPDAMGWNSTQWAKHLRCAKSSVVETATWKKLESARLQARSERMRDRRRKPKASDSRRD